MYFELCEEMFLATLLQAFLAHTREFVQQLYSVSHINLFLTELRYGI